ncbi:hypothetical protein FBY03_11869 [Pseudomonas sp. SJZ079]|uniref:hypothetical protein n=1 Tax=Pseudomonas sp. SJZ079 TaxID=2572887 RepID=UPI001199EB8E|nr:hypothetical protein [Pseudomonas sp. SJZ079]TWC32108.1 hypothetical protein FBY03_11869 [Pseudomonas sp. SJZ079]
MSPLHFAQLRYLSLFFPAWLAVFCMTHAGVLLAYLATVRANGSEPIPADAIGLWQDPGFPLYAASPLALHLLLGPRKATRRHDNALAISHA